MAEKPKKKAPAAGARRRRKTAGQSTGLTATELQAAAPPGEVAELHRAIEEDGGKALAVYREPYGGHWLVLAALPIALVEPTPYQRNLSDTHVRKLEAVIGKLGRFLDPIISVRVPKDQAAKYWTPNGHHRLSAMRTLGAKTIVSLVVPEPAAAYQILALNTEKAHNLREKALEVIRMYKELMQLDHATEEAYALEFEEPALITLGLCYEERPRFSGGAYHPVLKRVEEFLKSPLRTAIDSRHERARVDRDARTSATSRRASHPAARVPHPGGGTAAVPRRVNDPLGSVPSLVVHVSPKPLSLDPWTDRLDWRGSGCSSCRSGSAMW